jgi:hypothetical protein
MDVVKAKAAEATSVSEIEEEWFGLSPADALESGTGRDLPELPIDELVHREITLLGYQLREGMENEKSGKPGQFAVIFALVTGASEPIILITGASVIVKKLQKAHDDNQLPIKGTIVHVKSKNSKYRYYDLVPTEAAKG